MNTMFVFFPGTMIPLAVASLSGITFPAMFAIGTTVPLMLFVALHRRNQSRLATRWILRFAAIRRNVQFGYTVAWSDRMISFYGSIWVGALVFAMFRTRIKSLSPIAWLFIGIMPVGLDGITHMVNDALAGTSGAGFHDTNSWLTFLRGNILPPSFYAGDALSSFNSGLRWITGILFGLMTVWFIFPFIETAMRDLRNQAGAQLQRARFGETASP